MSNEKVRYKPIKYETTWVKKGELFEWIEDTLKNNGWIRLDTGNTTEGLVFKSKGVDGNSNIIVNLRDNYGSRLHGASNSFSKSTATFIEIRMMTNYIPSEVDGEAGTFTPTSNSFCRPNIGAHHPSFTVLSDIRVRYSCNANRMICLFTVFTPEPVTTFIMFGRALDNIGKEYENTGNTLIANYSYLYTTGTWGVVDRVSQERQNLILQTINVDRSFTLGKTWVSELSFSTALEGYKGTVEGLYVLNGDAKFTNLSLLDDDKIHDEFGNEYSIMYVPPTTSTSYPKPITQSLIAVCTKLAGEE